MKKTSLAIAVSLSALACLFSGSAAATPLASVTVTGMEYSPASTVHIASTVGSLNEYVYSGGFKTVTSTSPSAFEAWCIDIFQNTNFNEAVHDYNAQTGLAALGASKASLLGRLATESLGLVNNATTASAFQLAIWEIMNETGNTLSLTTGSFSASGASDNSIALANTWLSHLPGANTPQLYTLNVLTSSTHQDLAYFTAVPEPASIALMAIGLLGFGAARRKVKKG